MEQLYVDDYLGGTDSIEAAKRRVEETNTLFKEAQLNMRSYATKCEELRQFLEEKGLEIQTFGLWCEYIREIEAIFENALTRQSEAQMGKCSQRKYLGGNLVALSL